MAGIVAYGAYIPKLRLQRKHIADSWGTPKAPGEVAVGNFDEDSVTMAVEAARDCIMDDPGGTGGLYLASTTAPYLEKSCSTLVASVLDLSHNALTADFGGSLSAGLAAVISADNAVDDGLAESVLVSAAECRVGEPRSADEQTLGDGAGAVLIGNKNVVADIKGIHTYYDEIMGTWRTEEDRRVRDYNPRFYAAKGYIPCMTTALEGALDKFGIEPKDLDKLVFAAPDIRSHGRIGKSFAKHMKEGAIQDALFGGVGGCGCAQPLMMLAAALEDASPSDKILLACAGDAYHVLLLEVTDGIEALPQRRGIGGHLASRKDLESYAKFLANKELVEIETGEAVSSPIRIWRERKAILPLYGKKCNSCQEVYFPPRRVCPYCKSYDDNQDVRLQRRGKLFNYIHDYLYPSPDQPTTLTISDLEGGGRIFLQMTDRDVDDVELGMDVELTFRKIHEGAHFHNYYWKTRPVR